MKEKRKLEREERWRRQKEEKHEETIGKEKEIQS